MDQEVFQKYRKTYGVRFSSRQKRAARQALTEDFEDLGYQAHSLRHSGCSGGKIAIIRSMVHIR